MIISQHQRRMKKKVPFRKKMEYLSANQQDKN